MLREPYRHDFIAPRPGRERRAEVLDLAGLGRDHALDVMGAAMTPPVACDPRLVTFAPDGYWRGETHRLCDRPGSVARLLEELAAAGVSQAIIASAVPASARRIGCAVRVSTSEAGWGSSSAPPRPRRSTTRSTPRASASIRST